MLKAEVLIPEIWPADPLQETEMILTVIETEATSAERVSDLQVEMLKPGNLLIEDKQLLQQIETVREEMLILHLPEEEPAEPILQAQPIEVALNTAIRSIRTNREILRKLAIPVPPVEIQVVLFNRGITVAIAKELVIKDQLQHKTDRTIKDQVVPELRADSIASQRRAILVRPIPTEAQVLLPGLILHQQDLSPLALILHQIEAEAIRQPEVAVAKVLEV